LNGIYRKAQQIIDDGKNTIDAIFLFFCKTEVCECEPESFSIFHQIQKLVAQIACCSTILLAKFIINATTLILISRQVPFDRKKALKIFIISENIPRMVLF